MAIGESWDCNQKNIFITKTRNNEGAEEKSNFVLSNFRNFVIDLFEFSLSAGAG